MTVLLRYYRYTHARQEEHDTVEDALKAAYWGEETGNIVTDTIIADESTVVYDRETDPNILDFCEARGYDWVADDPI